MAISEEKMRMVIKNYFKTECDINTTINEAFEKGFRIGVQKGISVQINLCDSCDYSYPDCPSKNDDVIFGNGIGNDNICVCNKYKPSAQPETMYYPQVDGITPSVIVQPEPSTEIQEILNYLDTALHPIVSPDNWNVYVELYDMVSGLSSAQPERKTGHWIEKDDGWGGVYYECSVCGAPYTLIDGLPSDNKYNYCPNCGVDMRGDSDEKCMDV